MDQKIDTQREADVWKFDYRQAVISCHSWSQFFLTPLASRCLHELGNWDTLRTYVAVFPFLQKVIKAKKKREKKKKKSGHGVVYNAVQIKASLIQFVLTRTYEIYAPNERLHAAVSLDGTRLPQITAVIIAKSSSVWRQSRVSTPKALTRLGTRC